MWQHKSRYLTIATGIAAVLAFIFLFSIGAIDNANAYSIYGDITPTPQPIVTGGVFDKILSPFQNFFSSIGSVGTIPVGGVNHPLIPSASSAAGSWIQNSMQRFDAWLYGVAGFHIIGFLNAVLNIFSWILGLVKGAVDWLIELFRWR